MMMRNKLLTVGCTLVVALLCCSMVLSDDFTPSQLSSIERGMSSKKVKQILGDPILCDINEEGEVWTFRSGKTEESNAMEVRIWFRDGKVERMRSYELMPAGEKPGSIRNLPVRRYRYLSVDSCRYNGDCPQHHHVAPRPGRGGHCCW